MRVQRPVNWVPLIAGTTVIAITMTMIGLLVAARHLGRSNGTAASGAYVASPARSESPTPVVSPIDIRLSAPSANVVWAIVGYSRLYRSTDRGSHWELRFAFAGPFRSMSFIDDHEGWIMDSGSVGQCPDGTAGILHTTDAGSTWQQLSGNGIARSQCKEGIWFFDAKHGILAASDAIHPATIYRTSDGGKTWALTKLVPDPPNYQSSEGGAGYKVTWVKAFGSTLYLAATGTPYIYRSTDAGASWKWFTKWPSSASIAMVTETRWLDLTVPGQPMESTNGGQQFHQYASDFSIPATQFVFADANVGYASGRAAFQQTIDGGGHWTRLATPGTVLSPTPTPPMPSNTQLSAPSKNVVWALVADQYLYRSTDQGNTWERRRAVPTPVKGGSPLISFIDATTGWELVPTSGAGDCKLESAEIWRTTDGAATWQRLAVTVTPNAPDDTIPSERCKDAFYFLDSTWGLVALGDSTFEPEFHGTNDGGVHWYFASLIPWGDKTYPFRIVSIKAFDGTVLAQVRYGMTSYVITSTDHGGGWSGIQGSAVPDQASNISFLTPTHWLILQPTALETTDAGKTWHAFSYSDQEAAGVPSVFVFADDKVGYATVRGDIRRTTDGGAHFFMIKNSWP